VERELSQLRAQACEIRANELNEGKMCFLGENNIFQFLVGTMSHSCFSVFCQMHSIGLKDNLVQLYHI